MKLNLILFLLGIAIGSMGLLFSCSSGGSSDPDNPDPPVQPGQESYPISVTPTFYAFPAEGETTHFQVICEGAWNLIPSDDWFQVEPTSGTGNNTIQVTAAENLSGIELTAVLEAVSESGETAQVELTQPPVNTQLEVVISAKSDHFIAGDAAGLFIVNRLEDGSSVPLPDLSSNPINNAQFILDHNEAWNTADPIYWPDDHTAADAYFYYPWSAVSGDDPSAWPFSAHTDQTLQNHYQNSCVLYDCLGNVTPGQVLEFTPSILSSQVKAKITLDAAVQDVYTVTGVTFSGVRTEGTLDLTTGTLTASGQTTDIQGYFAQGQNSEWNTAIIIPPQTVEKLLITVTYQDQAQAKTLSREYIYDNWSLETGKSYQFNLLLNQEKDPVKIDDVTVSDWEDGGSFDLDFE